MNEKEPLTEAITLTISPANMETLRQLVQLLDFADGLTIAIARCNLPIQRRVMVEILKVMIEPLRIDLVELELQEPLVGLREAILGELHRSRSEGTPSRRAVFVYGLEHSLPSHQEEYPVLAKLNMGRELFQRDVPCALVIWLPDYALTVFARGAPDFWAWRSGVYEFCPEEQLMSLVARDTVYDSTVTATALSLERKHHRIIILERLLDDYRELGDGPRERSSQSHILHRLGTLRQALGDYAQARRLYKQSLSIAEQLGDSDEIRATTHSLGNVAFLQDDYQEARRLYEKSLKMAEELGDETGEAYALGQLGSMYLAQGEYEEAQRNYQRVLEMSEELGDKSSIATSIYHLGRVAYLQGKPQQAGAFYEKAGVAFETLGDRTAQAAVLSQLGALAHDAGDYVEAHSLYRDTLRIAQELGDNDGIASALHQLGRLAQDKGDYQEARRCYQESLKIAEKLHSSEGIARSLGQLGQIAMLEEDYETAVRLWALALQTFEALGSPDQEVIQAWFARLRKQLGEERFQKILNDARLS